MSKPLIRYPTLSRYSSVLVLSVDMLILAARTAVHVVLSQLGRNSDTACTASGRWMYVGAPTTCSGAAVWRPLFQSLTNRSYHTLLLSLDPLKLEYFVTTYSWLTCIYFSFCSKPAGMITFISSVLPWSRPWPRKSFKGSKGKVSKENQSTQNSRRVLRGWRPASRATYRTTNKRETRAACVETAVHVKAYSTWCRLGLWVVER